MCVPSGLMVPKNGSKKGTKKTPQKQAHPTHQLREKTTDDESSGYRISHHKTNGIKKYSTLGQEGQALNGESEQVTTVLPS